MFSSAFLRTDARACGRIRSPTNAGKDLELVNSLVGLQRETSDWDDDGALRVSRV